VVALAPLSLSPEEAKVGDRAVPGTKQLDAL
jgi:hypothetical protein